MSSGLNSAEILSAYEAVRADPKTDPTNWLLISSAAAKDPLALVATGQGGLSEMRDALADDRVAYGYARIEYANDAESTRTKFALVVWIGPGTGVMRRARVSIEAADVKRVLSHYSVQVDAESAADLREEDVVAKCRKAGGADYNGGRG